MEGRYVFNGRGIGSERWRRLSAVGRTASQLCAFDEAPTHRPFERPPPSNARRKYRRARLRQGRVLAILAVLVMLAALRMTARGCGWLRARPCLRLDPAVRMECGRWTEDASGGGSGQRMGGWARLGIAPPSNDLPTCKIQRPAH